MSKEQRAFDTDKWSMYPLDIKPVSEDEDHVSTRLRSRGSKKENPFSKEVVLRLIEWFEQL